MCSKIFIKIHAVLRKLHMIKHMTTLTMWPITPSPMCPIPQGAPSLSSLLTMIPICPHFPLSICQKRCQFVKKMSSCQKDVKLSKRCQMSKSQTHGLWRRFTKKINWHNEVHTYWCQFWHHIWWWPKTLKMCIESVKIDINMCEPHCVNLFFLWTFSIVCVFDFLTFDIFLTFWHLFDILTSFNLNHLSPLQGYFFWRVQRNEWCSAEK